MTNTLKDVPRDRLIELPVFEEMQMGMTTGLALTGLVPVSIFHDGIFSFAPSISW